MARRRTDAHGGDFRGGAAAARCGAADDRILDASEAGDGKRLKAARAAYTPTPEVGRSRSACLARLVSAGSAWIFPKRMRSMARDGSSPSGNVRRMWDGPAAVQFHDREDDRNHGTIVD